MECEFIYFFLRDTNMFRTSLKLLQSQQKEGVEVW